MADSLNGATKYVATHRPDSLAWGPVENLGADIVAGIRRVKANDGPDLIVWGSSTLPALLLEHGLADEYCCSSFRSCSARESDSFRDGARRANSRSSRRNGGFRRPDQHLPARWAAADRVLFDGDRSGTQRYDVMTPCDRVRIEMTANRRKRHDRPRHLPVVRPRRSSKAAEFYAATFPDSHVGRVNTAPGDFPGGKEGSELTVEFTVLGTAVRRPQRRPELHAERIGQLHGRHREPGGDRPLLGCDRRQWRRRERLRLVQGPLGLLLADHAEAAARTDDLHDAAEAKRAFDAMMTMRKIDIAAIEAAAKAS